MMTYEELKKKCPAQKLRDDAVMTGVVRLSFPHLFTPNTNPDLSNYGKYSCGLIANEDAEDTMQLLGDLINGAVERGKETAWKGKKDPKLDTERIVELKSEQQIDGDKWSIRSTAKEKPFRKVFDIKGNDITGEDERIYGGAYARAILRCYPWGNSGKYGVSFIIEGIQILEGGEPYGDAIDVKAAFGIDGVADITADEDEY